MNLYKAFVRAKHYWLAAGIPVLVSCAQAPPYVAPMAAPKPVVSYVNVPVSIPLASLEQAADAKVRRSLRVEPFEAAFGGGSAAPSCGIDAGYAIERGSVHLSGTGGTLVSSSVLAYWIKGRKQVPCPGTETVASCGTDGEDARTARMTIESALAIQPDLTVSIQSTPKPTEALDRCVIKPVGMDVTDFIMKAFDTELHQLLPDMDRQLAASLDLKSRMQAAWTRMGEPREIRPGVWLAWNPEGVGVMPIMVVGDNLETGVQLRVRPVITAGAKPASNVKPLPLAYSATQDDAFRLQLPVDVQQSYLKERLAQALELEQGGKTFNAGNFQVRIVDADVTGEGSQVQIHLTFTGDFNGTAILVGTPIYEAGTRTLSFPDLDYTLDSDKFLLNSASHLAHGQVRDRLRQRFTVELGDRIDALKSGLEQLLNREQGNVRLRGTVDDVSLLGVSRTSKDAVFTVFLAARGKVTAELQTPQ